MSRRYFLATTGSETYHYPIEKHLKAPDIQRLIELRILEKIDPLDVRTRCQKLSPVCRETAPDK
jgi:hypothetical protein